MTTRPLRRLLGLARRAADPTDDAGLLARFAAAGDADAFELLVWRHGGMVLGVCKRVLGDEHAAEDAFQATFLALARQAKSVRRDGCVAGWLHRVARRVAQRARRQRERRLRFARNVNLPDDPVVAAERRELSELVDEELDRLPERFRRPVVLCYLEGRSAAEAAERLGCPRGTVLSRLATAREKLRVRLLRRGVVPGLLPAFDILPPVFDGRLTSATVRAVVGNAASPPVIDLCNGVVRAMILSKLKLTAAVAMTVGLLGGGAGWVAMTPGGPGQALAAPQAKADSPRQNPDRDQRRTEEQVERIHLELRKAEAELVDQEEAWAKDRTELRLRLADAEEQYKRQNGEVLPESVKMGEAGSAVEQARATLIYTQQQSAHKDSPQIETLESKLKKAEEDARRAKESYEKANQMAAKRIIETRREMVMAEERLSLFDRLTALKRQSAQGRVEELQTRLSQLRDGTGRSDPTDRKVQALDRKLDDVLRELTELRRELKK
jgi:RNA polymerase sigma factor (sigma-70 family)